VAAEAAARRIRETSAAEVVAVLGFEDAGGTGESELGEIVLVKTLDHVGLGRGQAGLGGDQWQVVVNSCIDAVGFVGECAGSKVDVGAGYGDQLRSRVHIEKGSPHLLVDMVAQVGELGVDGVLLGAGGFHVAAQLALAEDTVARLGGDEFVVLLPDLSDLPAAERIAANLVESLGVPIPFADTSVPVSVSVGVCMATAGSLNADKLLRNADQALYEAKARGRNCFRVFTAPQIL